MPECPGVLLDAGRRRRTRRVRRDSLGRRNVQNHRSRRLRGSGLRARLTNAVNQMSETLSIDKSTRLTEPSAGLLADKIPHVMLSLRLAKGPLLPRENERIL